MRDILFAFLGAVISYILTCTFWHIRSAKGTLKIDRSNPQKDVYRLVVDNLEELSTKKIAILVIDNNAKLDKIYNTLSQK